MKFCLLISHSCSVSMSLNKHIFLSIALCDPATGGISDFISFLAFYQAFCSKVIESTIFVPPAIILAIIMTVTFSHNILPASPTTPLPPSLQQPVWQQVTPVQQPAFTCVQASSVQQVASSPFIYQPVIAPPMTLPMSKSSPPLPPPNSSAFIDFDGHNFTQYTFSSLATSQLCSPNSDSTSSHLCSATSSHSCSATSNHSSSATSHSNSATSHSSSATSHSCSTSVHSCSATSIYSCTFHLSASNCYINDSTFVTLSTTTSSTNIQFTTTCKSISQSSKLQEEPLLDPDVVVRKYPKYRNVLQAERLAVRLAIESYFGTNVMAYHSLCT